MEKEVTWFVRLVQNTTEWWCGKTMRERFVATVILLISIVVILVMVISHGKDARLRDDEGQIAELKATIKEKDLQLAIKDVNCEAEKKRIDSTWMVRWNNNNVMWNNVVGMLQQKVEKVQDINQTLKALHHEKN